MFGFNRDEDGSAERFYDRRDKFDTLYKTLPRARYYAWWVIHNCVSHPLIGLLPIGKTFKFHDWTSRKMHPKPKTSWREQHLARVAREDEEARKRDEEIVRKAKQEAAAREAAKVVPISGEKN